MGPGGSIQATHMVDFTINLGKSKLAGAYVPGGRGFEEGLVREHIASMCFTKPFG